MKCALCGIEKEGKSNTHYLTDSIIRTCLNQDGINRKEKGLYLELDNEANSNVNFQRETNPDRVKSIIGREISDDDIEQAAKTPCSVDNVFCKECETKFNEEIESLFAKNLLPKFRNADLNNVASLNIQDNKLFRLFFLLQFWRTAVCDTDFKLPENLKKELREIFNQPLDSVTIEQLNKFPLSVSYLVTKDGEYTANQVLIMPNSDYPKVIMMNDFVIQLYEIGKSYPFYDLHGLNKLDDYQEYINVKESSFKIKVIPDIDKKNALTKILNDKANDFIQKNISDFRNKWIMKFGSPPSRDTIKQFCVGFSESENITHHSELMKKYINDFIANRSRPFA